MISSLSPALMSAQLSEKIFADQEIYDKRANLAPSQRIGETEDIAATALFLASDNASIILRTLMAQVSRLRVDLAASCCRLCQEELELNEQTYGHHKQDS